MSRYLSFPFSPPSSLIGKVRESGKARRGEERGEGGRESSSGMRKQRKCPKSAIRRCSRIKEKRETRKQVGAFFYFRAYFVARIFISFQETSRQWGKKEERGKKFRREKLRSRWLAGSLVVVTSLVP